ncbi:hypothetical protein VTN00DRAFT_6701 [Thermoascus crustaceus]|uniref:uncharacterized protein n=1 Tax=Thermoascus crustaceus TaxID=5088 RepID=UPI003742435A
MPKKHNRSTLVKPVNPVHPSLTSSSNHSSTSDRRQHGSTPERSVNDLINHLRRTQVSKSGGGTVNGASRSLPQVAAPRSVHPSIRNLLEIPETPPPRPPPDRPAAARRVGVGGGGGIGQRRVRRTPGPPPPPSGFVGDISDTSDSNTTQRKDDEEEDVIAGRVLYRLQRLPGVIFPEKGSLQDIVLRSMARNWPWHLDYDGTFLAELPGRIKVLLLSYLAVYHYGDVCEGDRNWDQKQMLGKKRMQGLWPLFLKPSEMGEEDDDEQRLELEKIDEEISRLDLSGATGRSMSLKQLMNELLVSQKVDVPSARLKKKEDHVPSSWDEEASSDSDTPSTTPALSKTPTQTLRFSNLRFLSLAHPDPARANWSSLLNLLSHLSTITHLSLAHWPVPTLAHPSSTSTRHKRNTSLSRIDTEDESNNWAEASRVLKRLSRSTYCLKWLDLEGCGEWFGALSWNGRYLNPNSAGGGAEEIVYTNPGPEWNGSWRDVEWVDLGPGFLPESEEESQMGLERDSSSNNAGDNWRGVTFEDTLRAEQDRVRARRRREMQMEMYRAVMRRAKEVERHVLQVRKEGRGKWVRFSFGGEHEGGELMKRILEEL